jgi:hypothetical protein
MATTAKRLLCLLIPIHAALSLFTAEAAANDIDETLKNLDLSGFLRLRAWHTGSETKMPEQFPGNGTYNSVNYQDLLLRARLYLKVTPDIEIRAVFDISSYFGNGAFQMGGGSANLVTRDAYAVFHFSRDDELSIGMQPFSLPGGYILARDATGANYAHYLFNRKLKAYASFINAFDNARDNYGADSNRPKYANDTIFIAGMTASAAGHFSVDLYYAYENDHYTTDAGTENKDGRTARLHWAGIHGKLIAGNVLFKAGGIYNAGSIRIRDEAGECNRTPINAALFEIETGCRINSFQGSIIGEGATGDPNDPNAASSFQDIKSSHEFSFIIVDNFGGIALRESGESCWYGLYGGGLKLQYTLQSPFIVQLRLFHFRTARPLERDGSSSTWLGDECDIKIEYARNETVSAFFMGGMFFPQGAYSALEAVGQDSDGPIIECVLGMTITF